MVFHYPINQHAARSAVYDLACRATQRAPCAAPPHRHLAATTVALWLLTVATACAVRDLGVVFQVVGGVAGAAVIFVMPGVALARRAACCKPHGRGGAPMSVFVVLALNTSGPTPVPCVRC